LSTEKDVSSGRTLPGCREERDPILIPFLDGMAKPGPNCKAYDHDNPSRTLEGEAAAPTGFVGRDRWTHAGSIDSWRPTFPRASLIMITCAHRNQVRSFVPHGDGCRACLRLGQGWLHLRMCQVCGEVSCCDSSPNRHATAHFEATGHALMRSVEPGESWAWCFVDQQTFDSAEPAPFEPMAPPRAEPVPGRQFLDALYLEFLERGLAYFFPGRKLHVTGAAPTIDASLRCEASPDADMEFTWLGRRYRLAGGAVSSDESNLVRAIGRVLELRYHLLENTAFAVQSLQMFSGLAEDRYVSSYLEPSTFADVKTAATKADRITSVIEVLRVSALSTYENRPIQTGALLFGSMVDPCHPPPNRPAGAIKYSAALTGTRSFHRLCDGLSTLALVDSDGMLAELVDVREWSQPYSNLELPVPAIERYRAHCRATLCGGHACLVLTPNGEVKIFANGAQAFNFVDGRWKLTEAARKYRLWLGAIGDAAVAERLFTAAQELAEARRGALFVVLEDRSDAAHLIAPRDLVSAGGQTETSVEHQSRFQYLLGGKRLLEIAPAVLVSVARIDGAIVIDAGGDLLAFGAILRQAPATDMSAPSAEGGRTNAALGASRFGSVLMVSEDGLVSFFRDGRAIWQM